MVEQPTKKWHCTACGREMTSPDHVEMLFHLCPVGHTTGSVRPLSRDEERVAWARKVLGADLEASVLAKTEASLLDGRER